MAETYVENMYRRDLARARQQESQADFEEKNEGIEQPLLVGAGENAMARLLERQKQQDRLRLPLAQFQKEMASAKQAGNLLKSLKIAFGASLVLAYVAYFIWLWQYVAGNIFGSKLVSKLKDPELKIFYIITGVMFVMILAAVAILVTIYQKLHPLIRIMDIISFWS